MHGDLKYTIIITREQEQIQLVQMDKIGYVLLGDLREFLCQDLLQHACDGLVDR